VSIITDAGSSSREQGNFVVREAVSSLMSFWEAPFQPSSERGQQGLLEAKSPAVVAWVGSSRFEALLVSLFPASAAAEVSMPYGSAFCEGVNWTWQYQRLWGLRDWQGVLVQVRSRCCMQYTAQHNQQNSIHIMDSGLLLAFLHWVLLSPVHIPGPVMASLLRLVLLAWAPQPLS
jgi:hypothetical protein